MSGVGAPARRRNVSLKDQIRFFLQAVPPFDKADGAGFGAHDDRVGEAVRPLELNAAQQFAVRDAGGGKNGVVPFHQVVHAQHFVDVNAHFLAALELGLVLRQ